jgi:hypothetical protein
MMASCKFCGFEHRVGFCPTGLDVEEPFAPTKITITPQAVEHSEAQGLQAEETPQKPKVKKPFDRKAYMKKYMRKYRRRSS